MARVSVGLEIGEGSVKAVELIHQRNNYKLKKLVRVKIPAREGEDAQREEVTVRALRSLIGKYKINTKQVISGLGGESVIVRRIRMPVVTEKELDQAIRYEAEEYIPYPIDQVCLGFHILERGLAGEKEEEISVMLGGVKREIVDKHLHLLKEAGISPQIIDINAFALFNTFELSNPGKRGNLALLEIGHRTTSIVLLDKGSPFLIRNINLGGSQITQAIARELSTSYPAAEKVKEK